MENTNQQEETLEQLRAKLTPKERTFVEKYVGEANLNGAEAARLAGYAEDSARITASKLLTKTNIRAYRDALLDAESLSQAEVLHVLSDVAKSEWKEHVIVKTGKDGEVLFAKMDLRAKVEAAKTLAQAHGMLTVKTEHSGNVTVVREVPPGV